jgi:hypothetical protein
MFKDNIDASKAESLTDADKEAITAGVNLEIIKNQEKVVGLRMSCDKAANGAALKFCRTAPYLFDSRKMKICIPDSYQSLYVYYPKNIRKSLITFSLGDEEEGKMLHDILTEQLKLYEYAEPDKDRVGFEIKIPSHNLGG